MAKKRGSRRPPKTQTPRPRRRTRNLSTRYWDVTHQPLQCLVFLLPMVLAYEIGMAVLHGGVPLSQRPDLAAKQLLQWFFSLFGATGYYLPGLALVAVLLAWHMACRYPWRVTGRAFGGMAGESLILAVPVLLLNMWIPASSGLSASTGGGYSTWDNLLLSVGAGIYEELLFRLIVISFMTLLLFDIANMRQAPAVAIAVIVSSLAFAAHHYQPIGADAWSSSEFAFRAAAGAYLAAVFVLRGFGLAVGCHVVYDVAAFCLSP